RRARARRTYRENEIVLADRVDVRALVLRLRRDPFAPDCRRDDLALLGWSRDRRVFRVADESLQCGFAQRLIASGKSAHRAAEIADARDGRPVGADPLLRAARDDL